ncbi:hypothetical protein ACLB2K_047736 [Fragaria x ananassa]
MAYKIPDHIFILPSRSSASTFGISTSTISLTTGGFSSISSSPNWVGLSGKCGEERGGHGIHGSVCLEMPSLIGVNRRDLMGYFLLVCEQIEPKENDVDYGLIKIGSWRAGEERKQKIETG